METYPAGERAGFTVSSKGMAILTKFRSCLPPFFQNVNINLTFNALRR